MVGPIAGIRLANGAKQLDGLINSFKRLAEGYPMAEGQCKPAIAGFNKTKGGPKLINKCPVSEKSIKQVYRGGEWRRGGEKI